MTIILKIAVIKAEHSSETRSKIAHVLITKGDTFIDSQDRLEAVFSGMTKLAQAHRAIQRIIRAK